MNDLAVDVPSNVTIAPSIQHDECWLKPVLQASRLIPNVIGPAHADVKAEWDYPDQNHLVGTVVLTLSDGESTHQAQFVPDDFRNENHIYRRLYSLWGAVLKDRSERLMAEARRAMSTAITTPVFWDSTEEIDDGGTH